MLPCRTVALLIQRDDALSVSVSFIQDAFGFHQIKIISMHSVLFLSVFPVFLFEMSDSDNDIDVSRYPDGYITNYPTSKGLNHNVTSNNLMHAVLSNFPAAGTLTMHIYQLNETLAKVQTFILYSDFSTFNISKHFDGYRPFIFHGSEPITLRYKTLEGYDVKGEQIHISYSGMYECTY